LDLIFPDPLHNHTGVGFELGTPPSFPLFQWAITIYAKNGAEIGRFVVPAPDQPEPTKTFFGIWCVSSIGRINVCNNASKSDAEVVDDIQMWEERATTVEPATWGSIKNIYR